MNGYLHSRYAASLAEIGTPSFLPRSKAWVLVRAVPGTEYCDAMGCYPLFACQDWARLRLDLADIAGQPICLHVVTDPFGGYDVGLLRDCFPDLVRPFKEHYVVDLRVPIQRFVRPQHRRYAQRGLENVNIAHEDDPRGLTDEWVRLYANLVDRHGIKGAAAFSAQALAKQLEVPGAVVFRAVYENVTVGMLIWYVQGDVGYYHLGAYSDLGYEVRASYALFRHSIEFFGAAGAAWLSLGAGAGVENDATDGLSQFKRGWSTGTRTAYLCGRIFDHKRYDELAQRASGARTEFFPSYRASEYP